MQKKQGISLIVLVITIIVMIILAASVVITLSNTGIINRASEAVGLTNEAAVQDMAALIWADAYMNNKRGTELVSEVTTKLGEQGVTADKWNITVTDTGVSVNSKSSCVSGHAFGEWVTKVEASCSTSTNGTKERACSNCNHIETETVYYIHNISGTGDCDKCNQYIDYCYNMNMDTGDWEPDMSEQGKHFKWDYCVNCDFWDPGDREPCVFENGVCSLCGYVCNHSSVSDGKCTMCFMQIN